MEYDVKELEQFVTKLSLELYKDGKRTAYCRQVLINMLVHNLIISNSSLKDVLQDLKVLLNEARHAAAQGWLFKDQIISKFKIEHIN